MMPTLYQGKLPEWSIGPHSKCGDRVTGPGVRIPHFPQSSAAGTLREAREAGLNDSEGRNPSIFNYCILSAARRMRSDRSMSAP